jgi:hypothetical protein
MIEANPVVAACSQCCQSVSASAGTADLVKTLVTVLALPLSALTFWLGYRQREYERRRSYYQDVVIDAMLPEILEAFDQQSSALTGSGLAGLNGLASNRKTMPRSCGVALASFASAIFDLQDRIVQRVAIFDELQTEEIREAFQQTQDEVTDWFDDISSHKRRELGEIDGLLRKNQRLLIRLLYKGKMRSFR